MKDKPKGAMVMDVAYPIIASVLLGAEVADSPALARLSDAEAIITELKAVVREFVHEFKGEDFEAGLWPMMDRANAALAPPSDTTPRAEAAEARCTALEQEKDEKAESANREQIAALEQELDQLEQEIKQLKANRAG